MNSGKWDHFCRTVEKFLAGEKLCCLLDPGQLKCAYPFQSRWAEFYRNPSISAAFPLSLGKQPPPPLLLEKTIEAQRNRQLKVRNSDVCLFWPGINGWLTGRSSHAWKSILQKRETRFLHLNLVTFKYQKLCFLMRNVLKGEK